MSKETIVITKEEYERLLKRDFKLDCLEDGGVDNWEWCSESLEPYYEARRSGKLSATMNE
jgi:hypothetical protein